MGAEFVAQKRHLRTCIDPSREPARGQIECQRSAGITLSIAGVAVGGWLVTAPFHLGFKPFFQGIKMVRGSKTPYILFYG